MRIVNFILLLFLVGLLSYYWLFQDSELQGTRWTCNELSTNFISAPYQKYQEIGERYVLYFASSSNLTIFQKGKLVFKDGEHEKYEVIIDADYKVKKDKISVKSKKIDWHLKPKNAPIFIQDLDSLKDFETDLNFIISDEKLYFHNRKNHENTNFVCFAS